MQFNKMVDMHTHTDNSFDGIHSPIYLCEQAELLKLRAIAFTDHCEVDIYEKGYFARSMMQAYIEIAKARSAFKGQILVLEGIELGQAHYNPELAEKIISQYQYDVVIGSVHNLREEEDFYFIDFSSVDPYPLLEEYFKEILNLVQWNQLDILAHLTYPLRYIVGNYGIDIDLSRFDDIIDEILKQLALNGKALEINTSGLRQKIKETAPSFHYVRRFKELGGEFITTGSDAHKSEDLAKGLNVAMEMALDAGFSYVTLYQQRTPIPLRIE